MQIRTVLLIAVIGASQLACTSIVTLAPGVADLKVTNNASDVKACTSVGNVDGRPFEDPINGAAQMRNEAAGLGGDTLFVTSRENTGIAYRCGKAASGGK